MNCSRVMDIVYDEGYMPLFTQVQVWLHIFFCPNCAKKIERLEAAESILRKDFFPPSPNLENSIMAKIEVEEELVEIKDAYVPGGFSTRGWVIAGLVMFVSLATTFFGFNFRQLTNETGLSFLLPMGIIIGSVLTVYGLLFISSRLKELTERFGL